jgi:hypothetical protein
MTTNEERLKILTMLQEGKIDTAEAARLLEALESSPEPEPQSKPTGKPRHLHIKVTRLGDNKPVADIKVPVALVNAGIRLGAKFSPNSYGIDADALRDMLDSPEAQQIIDVTDEEDGEHVQIWLE